MLSKQRSWTDRKADALPESISMRVVSLHRTHSLEADRERKRKGFVLFVMCVCVCGCVCVHICIHVQVQAYVCEVGGQSPVSFLGLPMPSFETGSLNCLELYKAGLAPWPARSRYLLVFASPELAFPVSVSILGSAPGS